MNFDWYPIFNRAEFLALGLVSKTYEYFFEDRGNQSILVTNANLLAITFEDAFIPIEFFEKNPTVIEGDAAHYASYVDEDNQVWLGIEVED